MHTEERLRILDGLRAFAVIAVLFYHLDITNFFVGGFVGVDLFFVLSGFLITSLLKREFVDSREISLSSFYCRRVVRLLPSVQFLIATTLIYCSIFATDVLKGTSLDAITSLIYLHNWWQIINEQNYFDAIGRPFPLQHLWSLAIEEQFYLFFPLILKIVFPRIRLSVVVCAVILTVLALGFWGILVSLDSGLPESGNTSRVYYGTDTHGIGLLTGAAFGLWSGDLFLNKSISRSGLKVRFLKYFSSSALATIMLCFFLIICQFRLETTFFYFYGGSILLSSIFCILIIASCMSGGIYFRLLTSKSIIWVGTRSYALYLWHWPIFCFVRPGFEVNDYWVAQLLRILLTLILAELSYKYLECDQRKYFFGAKIEIRKKYLIGLFAISIGLISIGALLNSHHINITTNKNQKLSYIDNVKNETQENLFTNKKLNKVCDDKTLKETSNLEILFYGDSVLLGATPSILKVFNLATVRAAVGKQGNEGIREYYEKRYDENPHRVLVLHFGTNGFISEQIFDTYLSKLSNLELIILINVSVPKKWEDENNVVLARLAEKHQNIALIDWKKISSDVSNVFGEDKIHVTQMGGSVLVAEILKVLRRKKILNAKNSNDENEFCM